MSRKPLLVVFGLVVLALAFSLSPVLQTSQAQDIPRGGTVVISEGQQSPFVRNFNPYAPDPTRWTRSSIFEPLVIFNTVDGKPVFWLATDYKYSEDLLSLTFTLREGVKWSDGQPFTAKDVVFTFDLFKKFPALDRRAVLQFTESATAADDKTVTFRLNKVFTQAHVILGGTWILPEHQWSKVEDPVTFTNPDPVGTGPLTVVKQLTEQVLELCRNENYWQEGRPYIDCIRMPMYPGNDPANLAAANGELDWIGNFIPDIDKTFVARNPEKHHYYFWPGGGTVQLYALTTKAPFDDVKFRQAMSMAINYEQVVAIGMYGYTIPANATGLGPKHEAWVSQAALDKAKEMGLATYNPEGAKALLDEAGYKVGADGFRTNKDGSPLVFKIQVVNGWTDWVTSVQIISQNFQDVGLNATVETPDFGAWLNNLQQGTYDASIGWSTSGVTPWDFYRNVLESAFIGADNIANAQLWARWTSDEADKLLADFVATADEAKQRDIINQLQMLYVENVVAIPLFPGPTWYEWTTYRFTGFPTKENYYTQGSPWQEDPGTRLIVITQIHCIDNTSCGQ